MKIVNKTSLHYTVIESLLILRVVYENGPEYQINSELTYSGDYQIPNLTQDSIVDIHDLCEEDIRLSSLKYQDKDYAAINPQSFWSYLKKQLKNLPVISNATGRFHLPKFLHSETLIFKSRQFRELKIQLKTLPWTIYHLIQVEKQPLIPTVLKLDIHPVNNTLTAYLGYSLLDEEDSSLIMVNSPIETT